jgi:hypothetical protein
MLARRLAQVLLPAVVGVGVGAGCLSLDQETQVKDLRILAVKLEPPEVLFNFLHLIPPDQRGGMPLGPYGVKAKVLAVDPKGREVEVFTRICPDTIDQMLEGCSGYRIRPTASREEIVAVTPLLQPDSYAVTPDLTRGGELPIPELEWGFPSAAVDYMLLHDANGDISFFAYAVPAFPSIVVRARLEDGSEEEVAYKRFQLTSDISPSGIPAPIREPLDQLFRQVLGAGFCPEGTDILADVQCLKNRTANRNPSLERILYKRGGSISAVNKEDPTNGGEFQDFPARLEVHPGDAIRLRPLRGAHDAEPYQGIAYDLASQRLYLTNFVEDMVYTWTTTVGDIDGQSNEAISKTPDATYTVSPDAPEGPAHVWVVLHDQRGGIDWRRLDFWVLPPVPQDSPWWRLGL